MRWGGGDVLCFYCCYCCCCYCFCCYILYFFLIFLFFCFIILIHVFFQTNCFKTHLNGPKKNATICFAMQSSYCFLIPLTRVHQKQLWRTNSKAYPLMFKTNVPWKNKVNPKFYTSMEALKLECYYKLLWKLYFWGMMLLSLKKPLLMFCLKINIHSSILDFIYHSQFPYIHYPSIHPSI